MAEGAQRSRNHIPFHRNYFSLSKLQPLPPVIKTENDKHAGSYINVLLQGKGPVQVLIDTGSARNCVDESFVHRFQFPISEVKASNTSHFRSANGNIMRTLGMVKIPMQTGKVTLDLEFHMVKNLQANALIGRDFIHDYNVLLDLPEGHIVLRDLQETVSLFSWGDIPIMALTRDPVEIPPFSQKIVPVIIPADFKDEKVLLLEPINRHELTNFHVARTLVRKENTKNCQVWNDTAEPIFFKKNAAIATVSFVEDIVCVMENQDQIQAKKTGTIKHTFEELNIEIKNEEITEDQKLKFKQLINSFGDVFALTNGEIEGTDLMEYEIQMKPGAFQREWRHTITQSRQGKRYGNKCRSC